MANKKRFTFADAKAKIKELEQELADTRDAFITELERAEADIKADVSAFGWGDAAIFGAGFILGALLVWIF